MYVVCPAAWQLLHQLVHNAWGVQALLELAKFFADSSTYSVVSSPVTMMLPTGANGTSAESVPQGVSTKAMQILRPTSQEDRFAWASVVSCVCFQPVELLLSLIHI